MEELEQAIMGCHALEPNLHDLLTRARVPSSLDALGVEQLVTRKLVDAHGDLPAAMILDAQHGLRPTGARIELGPASPCDPGGGAARAGAAGGAGAARPRRRAGGGVHRFVEIAGHDPGTSIIGLRTGGNRWYGVGYRDAGAVGGISAVDGVEAGARLHLPATSSARLSPARRGCLRTAWPGCFYSSTGPGATFP